MKILKYGHIEPKQLKCRGCGAELEYTPKDVKQHGNMFHNYNYISCPVCGKWCFVDSKGDAENDNRS